MNNLVWVFQIILSAGKCPTQLSQTPNLYHGRKAALPLNIVIIGCGLGGLAAAYCLGKAGHRITVLESASTISEVGAGIQISPNMTRLLLRWGLGEKLKKTSVAPEAISFRRCEYNHSVLNQCYLDVCADDSGERIGCTRLGKDMEEQHGAPYYHVHVRAHYLRLPSLFIHRTQRADLHNMLFHLAWPFMNLRLNSKVVSLEPSVPFATLESGEVVTADVIIGADGIKSVARETVVGGPDKPVPTGDAAYRAIVPTSEMIKEPDLKELVDFPEMTGWMGPQKHVVGYLIVRVVKKPITLSFSPWFSSPHI